MSRDSYMVGAGNVDTSGIVYPPPLTDEQREARRVLLEEALTLSYAEADALIARLAEVADRIEAGMREGDGLVTRTLPQRRSVAGLTIRHEHQVRSAIAEKAAAVLGHRGMPSGVDHSKPLAATASRDAETLKRVLADYRQQTQAFIAHGGCE